LNRAGRADRGPRDRGNNHLRNAAGTIHDCCARRKILHWIPWVQTSARRQRGKDAPCIRTRHASGRVNGQGTERRKVGGRRNKVRTDRISDEWRRSWWKTVHLRSGDSPAKNASNSGVCHDGCHRPERWREARRRNNPGICRSHRRSNNGATKRRTRGRRGASNGRSRVRDCKGRGRGWRGRDDSLTGRLQSGTRRPSLRCEGKRKGSHCRKSCQSCFHTIKKSPQHGDGQSREKAERIGGNSPIQSDSVVGEWVWAAWG